MAHLTKAAEQPSGPDRKRNDRGLTTLEWLLIVAAVAGLAALAVVLVQNVVDDTAEQISGSSARLTAALVAAQEITDDRGTAPHTDAIAKCNRLRITYGDAFSNAETAKAVSWLTVSTSANYDGTARTFSVPACVIYDAAQTGLS